MKKIILLVAFKVIALNLVSGQNYLTSMSEWYIAGGDLEAEIYNVIKFKANGDTIINDNQYLKLQVFGEILRLDDNGLDTLEYSFLKGENNVFIREEGTKFFGIRDGIDTEIIDFNLSLNEVINIQGQELEVIEIDSLIIGNNARKVFTLSNNRKIYEGIGTDLGLFWGLKNLGDEAYQILLCYMENNEVVEFYSGGIPGELERKDCGEIFLVDLIEENPDVSIKVFPNPFVDIVRLKSDEDDIKIELLNLNGQVLNCPQYELEGYIEIDMSEQIQGVYFLNIYSNVNRKSVKILKL